MSDDIKQYYEFGPFRLDPAAYQFLENGKEVEVTAADFDVLVALIKNRDRVVAKDELKKEVWDGTVDENSVEKSISNLRKALPGETYIKTIRGRGYRFTAPVREVKDEEPKPPAVKQRLKPLLGVLIVGVLSLFACLLLIDQFSAPRLDRALPPSYSCAGVPSVPTFNPFPITYGVGPDRKQGEPCKDFPLLSMKKGENGQYPANEEALIAGVTAHAGDEIYGSIYLDNGGPNNLGPQITIHNIKLETRVSNEVGQHHFVYVFVTAETNPPQPTSFTYNVNTAENEKLEVIPESGEMYDWQGRQIKAGLNVGNTEVHIEELKPGFEYALFIRFRIKVISFTQTTP